MSQVRLKNVNVSDNITNVSVSELRANVSVPNVITNVIASESRKDVNVQ